MAVAQSIDIPEVVRQTEEFCKMLRDVNAKHEQLSQRVAELDIEVKDIYHEIERPRCNAKERNKLSTKLQKALGERRALKDKLKALKPVIAFCESDKYTHLTGVLGNYLASARAAAETEQLRRHLAEMYRGGTV
ncbi:hypothetical protein FACS1894202_11820 [Clostridia bacterium]|nr:hypothetical protein FACS1894202_11820 [Clostridia bacterium]